MLIMDDLDVHNHLVAIIKHVATELHLSEEDAWLLSPQDLLEKIHQFDKVVGASLEDFVSSYIEWWEEHKYVDRNGGSLDIDKILKRDKTRKTLLNSLNKYSSKH